VGEVVPPIPERRMNAKAERDAWREIVRRYLAELENPAPDYTMRRIYRDWMRDGLNDPDVLWIALGVRR
jgi:hypothetical protein